MNSPNTCRATHPILEGCHQGASHRHSELLVKELVLQNKAVKIDDLAIFSIGVDQQDGSRQHQGVEPRQMRRRLPPRSPVLPKVSSATPSSSLDANAKNAMDLLNSSESSAGDDTTGDTTAGRGHRGRRNIARRRSRPTPVIPAIPATTAATWDNQKHVCENRKKE